MTDIYVYVTAARFHAREDCSSSNSRGYKPKKVLSTEMGRKDPCKVCYPTVPHTKKVVCEMCSPRVVLPCRHNGGVKIKTAKGTSWTWPERAVFSGAEIVYGHSEGTDKE